MFDARVASSACVIVAALLPGAPAHAYRPTQSPPNSTSGWIDSVVRHQSRILGLPGVGVAVVKNGGPIYVHAYGTRDVRQPLATVVSETPFNIASLSKPFTATIALQLVREGKLTLEAPARRHLRWLPTQYAAITVRQLLSHTSGIVRDVRRSNEDDPAVDEFRRRIIASGPSAPPGARYEYSNAGFTVLGWIIEAVERAPLEVVLQRRVFGPLAMTDARYREPLAVNSRRALPHNVVDAKPQPVAYVTGGFGSGGVSLSINDLSKFAGALQQGSLLSANWRDSAWSRMRLADGSTSTTTMFGDTAHYGFGWFIATYRGRRAITHGGGINGYSSMLLHFPAERLTVAVIANARAPVEPIVRAIVDRCLEPGQCLPVHTSPSRQEPQ